MRTRPLFLICLLIILCACSNIVDNQKMIKTIDQLEISKTIVELETDSIGNVLDTLSLEYFKFDEKGRQRFVKKIYWIGGEEQFMVDNYKADGDLFYREGFNEDGKSLSVFETKRNGKGKILKAYHIDKYNDPFDTLIMDYSREFYENGKKKILWINVIHEELEAGLSKMEYDEYENPLLELNILDEDTISFQTWEYLEARLQKSTYTFYLGDTSRSIYYFGEEKRLLREEEFKFKEGEFIKYQETEHFYDNENEKLRSIVKNKDGKEIKFIKYLIEN